jgi:hypothetical protein
LAPIRLQRDNLVAVLEHDPEKHARGLRPDGWKPVFPWLTNAERVCAEIMLKTKSEKRDGDLTDRIAL